MQEKRIIINGKETPYLIRDDGTVYSEKRNRVLKGTIKRNEYQTVYLTIDGTQYNLMVHRLVAEYFIPNPNNYNIVHHIDGNKLNNKVENLMWVTAKQNMLAVKSNSYTSCKTEKIILDDNWKQLSFNSNYYISNSGECFNKKTNHLLNGAMRNGYKRFTIDNKKYSAHKLVYEYFIGEIPLNCIIDHINGNKLDNRLENLRAVTQTENMKNAYANGHKGQIPISQYDLSGKLIHTYSSIQEAADTMHVTHHAINDAANRHGTSCGFYWVKQGDELIIKSNKTYSSEIPDGFIALKDYPGYYLHPDGRAYSAKSKSYLSKHYTRSTDTHFSYTFTINGTKKSISINKLLPLIQNK